MTEKRTLERRRAIIEHAYEIGITEAYFSLLVEKFFTRLREHEKLGSIFSYAIGNDWTSHLFQMKKFWSSVTMNSGQYSVEPVPAHQKYADAIGEWHFDEWLGLFKVTLNETAPNPEATTYIFEQGERIASSLKLVIFGLPSLRPHLQGVQNA